MCAVMGKACAYCQYHVVDYWRTKTERQKVYYCSKTKKRIVPFSEVKRNG